MWMLKGLHLVSVMVERMTHSPEGSARVNDGAFALQV